MEHGVSGSLHFGAVFRRRGSASSHGPSRKLTHVPLSVKRKLLTLMSTTIGICLCEPRKCWIAAFLGPVFQVAILSILLLPILSTTCYSGCERASGFWLILYPQIRVLPGLDLK
jgi:hypothetical protein